MTLGTGFRCVCGAEHSWPTETSEIIQGQIARFGECTTITTPEGSWKVPRVYIAAHGLIAAELPLIADVYGFEVVT